MNGEKVLDISWGTIFKIIIVSVSFYILYLIRDILIWFVFALVISILLNPPIEFLQRRKVPRVIAVIFLYLAVFGLLSLLVYLAASFFINEIQQFAQFLPQYLEKISPFLVSLGIPVEMYIQSFGGNLGKLTTGLTNALFAIFGGIVSTFFTITMAIFLSMEQKPIEKVLSLFFPKKYEAYALNLWSRSQRKVTGWFLTRIIACLFIGVLSYIAFLLFNTRYKISLALIAGILNFIPVVGPMVTGALIFLITLFDSSLKAILVLTAFILIQQVENNILTPILSRKIIGLSPVLVLIALAIGAQLWGILGAILVIPLAGILFEFLKEFLHKRKEEKPAAA